MSTGHGEGGSQGEPQAMVMRSLWYKPSAVIYGPTISRSMTWKSDCWTRNSLGCIDKVSMSDRVSRSIHDEVGGLAMHGSKYSS